MFKSRIEKNEFIMYLDEPESEIYLNNANEMLVMANQAKVEGYRSITIDLKNLKFIDSSGVGRLIKISKMMPVVLQNASEHIINLFNLTGVKSYFTYK